MKRTKKATEGKTFTVALAGNPNVGKSTLFNALTGLHQHTGNWTGKTVDCAQGEYTYQGQKYRLVDLPGTYSLHPHAAEEQAAKDFLCSEQADLLAVVCDAGALERQLILVLQLMLQTKRPLVVILNFMQEAQKRGKRVKSKHLQAALGVPVVCVEAKSKKGMADLKDVFLECCEQEKRAKSSLTPLLTPESEVHSPDQLVALADKICGICIQTEKRCVADKRDRKIDALLTGKWTGFPVMLLLLAALFWITVVGVNGISDALMLSFSKVEQWLLEIGQRIGLPSPVINAAVLGVFRTAAWVVAVMLPPMAIFFPFFTILEDLGYLPRMAFNLDRFFSASRTCGKQALTMCMGFGCHAVGVSGCRIIDSPRERRIAMLTNGMVPCNGSFPTLIALIGLYLAGSGGGGSTLISAAFLTLAILLCVLVTLAVSNLLSRTLLRGESSSFVLELPPYRTPRVGQVIVRSVLDRTLFVLGRALAVAAPAGLLLWLLANVYVGGIPVLTWISQLLDPFGRCLGMDGAILLAFVLALPANEIFFPILLMIYRSGNALQPLSSLDSVKELLLGQGWTLTTAVCVILFLLFHWPCATTLWTIKKESGSWREALLGAAIPTSVGAALCFCVWMVSSVFS